MKKRVVVRGPALTQSGYGEHARFVLRALRSREDLFDIYFEPISWGKTNWIWEDTEERRWMDTLIQKTIMYKRQGGQFDISAQVTIPNEWENVAARNVGITAGLEMSKVSPHWLQKGQEMHKIITISEHSRDTFRNTSYTARKPSGEQATLSCTTAMDIVRYPVKDIDPDEHFELNLPFERNFLSVAQWGPRKNVANLIKWFIEEFSDEEVGLVVKLNKAKNCLMDSRYCEASLKSMFSDLLEDAKCEVYLLHGSLSEGQMSSLYSDERILAYVTTTHGEGFGLPIYEAAYNGMPVVAPDWSGHIDFLRAPVKIKKRGKRVTKIRPAFARVNYRMQQVPPEVVWKGVVEPDAAWAVPEEVSFKRQLRDVIKDPGRFQSQAKVLQEHIEETYSEEKQYAKMCESILGQEVDDSWLDGVDDIIKEFE